MRTLVIRSSDIGRCPIQSLSPSHYRDDGSCLCKTRERGESMKWVERFSAPESIQVGYGVDSAFGATDATVRLIVGVDGEELTPAQARDVAHSLIVAAAMSEPSARCTERDSDHAAGRVECGYCLTHADEIDAALAEAES